MGIRTQANLELDSPPTNLGNRKVVAIDGDVSSFGVLRTRGQKEDVPGRLSRTLCLEDSGPLSRANCWSLLTACTALTFPVSGRSTVRLVSHSKRNHSRREYAPVGFSLTTWAKSASGRIRNRAESTGSSTPSHFKANSSCPANASAGACRGVNICH